jgi:acyl-CoA synthetase (NDP forming)
LIDFFFDPKGIAVVGATPEPNGGRNLLTNLTLGYEGPVYPVNPKYHEILGLKCYSKVSEIEGPVDLALIFIPAQAVPQVLEDCIRKDVRGAIVESSGFAEVGPEGKTLQDKCLDIARMGRLRIWGPNCMGLIDTSRFHVFSFIVPQAWKGVMNAGRVSLIVQSGLLSAGFITTLMGNKTLGLAKVCSIGNKSDVEETESSSSQLIEKCFASKPKSFLIQPMLKGDLELIAGIIRDPQFGPTAMLGLGGVWAEVYRDVVFRLVPFNKEEILKMVSDLKGQALLKGYRGSKPVNMESLTDWLIKLGWLVMTFEEIQEIDVNPLLIVEGEPVAIDATIIFR